MPRVTCEEDKDEEEKENKDRNKLEKLNPVKCGWAINRSSQLSISDILSFQACVCMNKSVFFSDSAC